MRTREIAVVVALVTVVATSGAAAQPAGSPHLRALSPASRKVITDATERSSVVHGLIEALEGTNVVVYVGLECLYESNMTGYMSFLTEAGDFRYLVVRIDMQASAPRRIVTLGHELQHALEVAAEAQVRDQQAFARFYHRIGWRWSDAKYETDLARQTGMRVERDLAGFRPAQ